MWESVVYKKEEEQAIRDDDEEVCQQVRVVCFSVIVWPLLFKITVGWRCFSTSVFSILRIRLSALSIPKKVVSSVTALEDELLCFPSHFSGPTPTSSFQHSSQA